MTMKNKYSGECYRCNKTVRPGDGYFQRYMGGWKLQHDSCCQLHRDIAKYISQRAEQGDVEAEKLCKRMSNRE